MGWFCGVVEPDTALTGSALLLKKRVICLNFLGDWPSSAHDDL
ncbi:MAG: hypothetical protein RKH07_00125 [Gammaproteobacteria bacterium]